MPPKKKTTKAALMVADPPVTPARQSSHLYAGGADDGPPAGGNGNLTATTDRTITIAADDIEGFSTPETQQQQGEAPVVPLGDATSASARNTTLPERQSRLAALLAQIE